MIEKIQNGFQDITKGSFCVSERGFCKLSIFEKNYMGLVILISPHCKETIADFTYFKETSDGKKSKMKVKDPHNEEIKYEEFGHTSDVLDYFWTEWYS